MVSPSLAPKLALAKGPRPSRNPRAAAHNVRVRTRPVGAWCSYVRTASRQSGKESNNSTNNTPFRS
eukprot:scaffold4410_cov32-Tisochrysis_lutea.AAC.4